MNQSFEFMDQSPLVARLLTAAVAALPHCPEEEREALEEALQSFESFGVPTLWSAGDVWDEFGLTAGERREAVGRFIANYETKNADYVALETHSSDVLAERVACIKVEYDATYTGGDYAGVGSTVLIPCARVDALAEKDPSGGDGVALAFTEKTQLDPSHIIHYSVDERYNEAGERLEA